MPHEMGVNVFTQSIMQQWLFWASEAMPGFLFFPVFWIGGMLFEGIWSRLKLRTHQNLRQVFKLIGDHWKACLSEPQMLRHLKPELP